VCGQNHAPAAFTPEKDTVPIVQEARQRYIEDNLLGEQEKNLSNRAEITGVTD
jgi:hypothetical protein